ncbi:MAG: hypothetical protein OXG78_04650 [Chloroflexi bacterium]|nr:hypothetical protein [Chloroflexota bacterium]
MSASKFEIRSRHREHPGIIASPADFEWTSGGTVDAESLLDDPRYTLYCLDHKRQLAIFTALPADVDLSRAPFFYQAQFDQAEYLVALPFADFLRRAEGIPAPRGLLCLHNIGRCGSTVLCRALSEIDGVTAFSEPDALSSFISRRDAPVLEQHQLLRACVAWLCRPAIRQDNSHIVIKFRNQAAGIMPLYVDALPQSKHIFMTRNVIDWLASFHRLRVNRGDRPTRYNRAQIIDQQADYYQCPAAEFEVLAPPDIRSYFSLEGRALGWLYMLGRYLELRERGADIAALRYEDLGENRDAVFLEVLRMMGLPDRELSAAQRAFETDAQAGTIFARDGDRGNVIPLPAKMHENVRRILAAQPEVSRPDFILNGTIGLR